MKKSKHYLSTLDVPSDATTATIFGTIDRRRESIYEYGNFADLSASDLIEFSCIAAFDEALTDSHRSRFYFEKPMETLSNKIRNELLERVVRGDFGIDDLDLAALDSSVEHGRLLAKEVKHRRDRLFDYERARHFLLDDPSIYESDVALLPTPHFDAAVAETTARLQAVTERLREAPTPALEHSARELSDILSTARELDDEDRLLADAYACIVA